MFILTKVADLVEIQPEDLRKLSMEAIQDNINAKYANKVIPKIGLCISLYDVLWTSEGLIGQGRGTINVNVEFRLLVFRPFKGEVMLGRISSSTPHGMHIRTDFFDDIFVPASELPEGCAYDHQNQVWAWNPGEDSETLYYERDDMLRFQVIDEEWRDQTPEGPRKPGQHVEKKVSPYSIKATLANAGLGLCAWWDYPTEDE